MSPRHFHNKNTNPCFVPSNYTDTPIGKLEEKIENKWDRIISLFKRIVKFKSK